jgi:adenylosuccinate lyase
MKENLEKSRGLIFSEAILLLLTKKGITREEAYKIVQKDAMEVWGDKNKDFKTTLLEDPEVLRYLTATEVETAFDVNHHFRNLDHIFERVFGK